MIAPPYGPLLTIVDSTSCVRNSFSSSYNPQFGVWIDNLEQRDESVRREAIDPMTQDLAHLGFVGAQDLSQTFDGQVMFLFVNYEFLADVPSEPLKRSGSRCKHQGALRAIQRFSHFF